MSETKPLLPGDPESIGAYRLTGRLGEGGQGVVFMGSGPAGENVAVKLLQANLDTGARQRFVRELESTKKVARFCTAQVLDADVDGDRPFIVSEYVPGPSLSAAVAADGVLSGGALERLAIGTLTALVAIHQAGVIHRDFKPHNVILSSDGPRVIDFGIAKALDSSSTQASGVIGTPAYMAPEQIEGKQVGFQADIFSWGLTMAFAANGRPPFGTDSITSIIGRILHGTADLGTMTGPVRDLVLDALAKDPLRRPTAKELLMQLLGGPAPQTNEPQTALLEMGEDRAASSTDPARRTWNTPGVQAPPPPYAGGFNQQPPPYHQTEPPQQYVTYQPPPAYGQQPAYGQTTQSGQHIPAQAPPPRRSGGKGAAIVLTVVVAVLLLVGGTVLALNKISENKETPTVATSDSSAPTDSESSGEQEETETVPSQTASSAPQPTKPTYGALSCTDTGTHTLPAGTTKSGIGFSAAGGTVTWAAKVSGPGSLSSSNGTLDSGKRGYVALTLTAEERAAAGSSTLSVTGASGGSCTRTVTWTATAPTTPSSPTGEPTATVTTPAGNSDGGGEGGEGDYNDGGT
jgi:eukaryotic-like serine/threonine-protein kinase